jgi:hypothetical protein
LRPRVFWLCRDFYEEVVDDVAQPFEIVFVSSDRSASEMQAYMVESHGEWLALDYGEQQVKKMLSEKYSIRGIPALVVVRDCVPSLGGLRAGE